MRDRESKKQALLELIKKDPEAVVELLLDLMERVEFLEQKLALNSRNSSKPPSSDGYNKPKPTSLRKKGRRKSGGQPGHTGKTLELSKDPDRIIKHTLSHCPLSGESFTEKDIVNIMKRQVFDLPEPKLWVDEHWIYQYKNASGRIVTAEVPEGVSAPVQYGKRFQSWLVYLNDYQLLPLNRTRQMCADLYGYWVSEDTILKARQQCYEGLEGFERQVKEILGKCAIAHADETGLKTDKWGRTLLFSVDEWRNELFAPTVPRSARVQYEGARYHIINRGNYRKDLFRTHKTDRAFTEVMLEACERYQWSLHAYVLMSNHYHLCVETPQANLSDGMHWLQSTFANKFSRFSGERGHVFQGRYQSLIIEGDYGILNVVDYIHLNPVRAGVVTVDRLKAYTNSSFPKYFTKYRHPNLRCEDFLHEAGGLSPSPGGMRSYHKRLKLIMEDSPQEREKLFKDLSRGWYIGTKQGKDQLSAKVEQGIAKASVEAKRELEHIRIEKLIKLCLKQLHKNQKDIEEAKKSAQWKIAIASHMKANAGIKNPQLCAYLNLGHPTTMSKLVGIYNQTEKNRRPYSKQLKTLNN